MKRFFLLLIFIFSFANVVIYSQPKLEFVGGDSFDWGEVKQSEGPLKAKVKIKNTGNKNLEISKVKPACGCTTAPLDKDNLKPGETATLDVTLQISKDAGKIKKVITLYSNDPVAQKDYFLKAKIWVPVSVFPKTLSLGSGAMGVPLVGKIILTNNTKAPIKILKMENNVPELNVNIKAGTILPQGKDFAIEGKITASKPGNIEGKLTLKTDSKEMPEITLNVFGFAQ